MKRLSKITWYVDLTHRMHMIFTVPGHHAVEMIGDPDRDQHYQLVDPDETHFQWCLGHTWYTLAFVEHEGPSGSLGQPFAVMNPFLFDHLRRDPRAWLEERLPSTWLDQWEIEVSNHADQWSDSSFSLDVSAQELEAAA